MLKSRSVAARNVPIVAGVCLPKGRLVDAVSGYIEGFDLPVVAQFEVRNRWNDGSVKWMLASFVAPNADEKDRELTVLATTDALPNNSSTTRIATVTKGICGDICIVTRDLTCEVPTEKIVRLMPCLCDLDEKELPLEIDDIREEIVGPVRQVCVVTAHIQSKPFITLQFRLTHWIAVGLLQVETRLRNTRRARHAGGLWDLGDPGSFHFGSLEIAIGSDDVPASAVTKWKVERSQAFQTCFLEVFLKQFGSGGSDWNCSNHVTASGASSVTARGYEVQSGDLAFSGNRAEPVFLVHGDCSCLAVAVPEFWQQFPGSVAAAMGTLEVGLFPALPPVNYELQGGEQKTKSFWISTSSKKSHPDELAWIYSPPRLQQSPESIAESNVLPWFQSRAACSPTRLRWGTINRNAPASCAADLTTDIEKSRSVRPVCDDGSRSGTELDTGTNLAAERFAKYLHDATTGSFSLEARRESIDEYGWRNFGDVPADHEQTHYAGSNTIVSHYNNQFDMIDGAILQWASTGDTKWFDLFEPLARHVMDIDIYHTREDRAAFNGGLFWHTDHYVDASTSTHRTYSRHNQNPGHPYGGGPGCEHNYTTGLLHYYFLTGNPEARESVLSLADWVIAMDDGRNTVFGLLDTGSTGAASATVFADFHGPGRGAGNSINALLDAWLLTGEKHYLAKLEELIRRCVHPLQNPDELHLLDAEGHWSYTVFLNALGRYLLAKCDAEQLDGMYAYSGDVMQTYGRWMAANERRTLDRPEELQYPTAAWAAQDFRKANVLRIAASCEDDATHAADMLHKANAISDAAWKDMAEFGDARLTARCLSILMTEGPRDLFHRTAEPTRIPACRPAYDFGAWTMFVPQKQRIKRMLKSPKGLFKAAIGVLNPGRVIGTLKALRRQL